MVSPEKDGSEDLYSRVDYRRVVAWPERIRRESSFLMDVLNAAPEASVLDLGCGTGEHSRFLAEQGFRVVGVDRSEAMLEKAQEGGASRSLLFIRADLRELGDAVQGSFGAAISLGNTLVHLTESQEISTLLTALAGMLDPGGVFMFQILNYERIFKHKIRYLPLNFREERGEQLVFLRLMELLPDNRVIFCPSTLRFDPEREPHLEVVKSKAVQLRGWTRRDLAPMLENAGFQLESVFGDMQQGPFQSDESQDLVIVCRRRAE